MGSRILGSIGEGLAFLGGSFVSFPLFFIPKGGFTKGGFTGQTVPDS
jgi:hypothetical protein